MTYYVISAIVGAAYGALAGLLKYILLWKKMLTADESVKFTNAQVVRRMIISYVLNAVILLIVLFVKNIMPLDFATTLIAAAIGLSLVGKVYSINKIYRKVED